MSSSLIIVESPTKAKIINRFLGKHYNVISSMGHVRDLPVRALGIDVDNGFEPEYNIIKGKGKTLDKIKSLIKKSEKIYLAMDEDREGEAIGWHIIDSVNIKEKDIERIVFHEITEDAIRASLENPRHLNMNLVNAQQARRLLDRLVGYKISPILSKKIRKGLSAGRVQSIGLELIVVREKERKKFVSEKYYSIEGLIEKEGIDVPVVLVGENGKKFQKLAIKTKESAEEIVKFCSPIEITVKKITEKEKKNYPSPPFITSTLQQESYNRLKFNPEKTMRVAQQLYEGIEMTDGTSEGLITYMRTDSVKTANEAIKSVRKYIKKGIGEDYLPEKQNTYKSRKSAQEAHECIRPTSVNRLPDKIENSLSKDQFKLYKLIWERFVASQLKYAVLHQIAIDMNNGRYDFKANGQQVVFDGYTKVWKTAIKETDLPLFSEGEKLKWKALESKEHETKPPARYTPATLVSELEKNGIGRPSTYATIINTLFARKYIVSENGGLVPQDIGFVVTEALEAHFPTIVNKEFTAKMENDLDSIANGNLEWRNMLGSFYDEFSGLVTNAQEKMTKIKDEETDVICPKCGSEMVIRWGRNGKFLACSAYPKCRQTHNIDSEGNILKEKETDYNCPKCSLKMLIKRGRFGSFMACSGYPKCKTTLSIDKEGNVIQIPLGYERCPECGKDTVIRSGRKGKFLACTGYPSCKFSKSLGELEKKNG